MTYAGLVAVNARACNMHATDSVNPQQCTQPINAQELHPFQRHP
jgi:hypothetical protein